MSWHLGSIYTECPVWHKLYQWEAMSELGMDLPRQPPSRPVWKTKELTCEERQQQGTAFP